MYFYRRTFSSVFRDFAPKRPIPIRNNKLNMLNRSCYSQILDNRLKSSLESNKFIKSMNNSKVFPRYDKVNTVLSKYNISLVTQSASFAAASSTTVELTSEDEVPEMTDEAIVAKSTDSSEYSSSTQLNLSNEFNLSNDRTSTSGLSSSDNSLSELDSPTNNSSTDSNSPSYNTSKNEKECSSEDPRDGDVKGTFKGQPLLGKEHGSVYTKHEPTMFGDWSHMGRVTDF